MHDERELERMAEWGATVGQVEHRAVELGLRDIDEPSADPEWWAAHIAWGQCPVLDHADGILP